MGLLEALTLELAPSISKLIVKYWCKDEVGDLTADFVKFISGKTKDITVSQRLRRQIEEIGESVTNNLIPIFEIRFRMLSEIEKTTVVLCVKDALDYARLNTDLLLELDLDPLKLSSYIINNNNNYNYLVNIEMNNLYRMIINDISQSIIDIASKFPLLTEKGLAELLKRDNLLMQLTKQVLNEVSYIREISTLDNEEESFLLFETEYRRTVVRKLDLIQLFGANLSESSRRHKLSVAYISLFVDENNRKKHTSKNNNDGIDAISVNQAIADNQHILIKGAAGSGKTTLLQWIAVNSARKSHSDSLVNLNDCTPFFVRLRQCIDGKFPIPEQLPALLAPLIAGTMPTGWVRHQLDTGKGLVLIDGVDEISSNYRTEVREWVSDLIATFPLARFIVTSRPHAIEDKWLTDDVFHCVELLPMDYPDIISFIEHWHDSVTEASQDDEEKAELKIYEESLKLVVGTNKSLLNLATSPLLCSMICALNRDRRQQLPSDRIELYEACTELLLERRDIERKVDLVDYPKIGLRQKLVLLEQISYWLIRNGTSMIAKDSAIGMISATIKNMPTFPPSINGGNIMRFFIERSGMLREPIAEHIDFTHRTFQEFLAAKSALDNNDIGLMLINSHDVQWQEVIVLAAGRGSKKQAEEIIQGLIRRGDCEPNLRHQLHLIAVDCLSTTVELSSSLMEDVKKRLAKLMPSTIGEAKAIASAGDLAVPYLQSRPNMYSTTAVACIRALSLIGTDLAKNSIKSYAGEKRTTVIKEILKSSRLFNAIEFAELAQTLNVGHINFDNIDSLTPICALQKLKSIYIYNCNRVNTLEPLSNLHSLRRLTLWSASRVNSLQTLSSLKNLEQIHLHNFPLINDLNPIFELDALSTVTLSSFKEISKIDGISDNLDLETLAISKFDKLSDISVLSKLCNLNKLILSDLPLVSDISFIRNLTSIKQLTINDISSNADISLLVNNGGLTSLKISNMKISNQSNLSKLTSVKKMEINVIPNSDDIECLPPNLSDLQIASCCLQSLKMLKNHNNIKNLTLIKCGDITDISDIESLHSLKRVTFKGIMTSNLKNQIKELTNNKKLSFKIQVSPW